jgi:transposase
MIAKEFTSHLTFEDAYNLVQGLLENGKLLILLDGVDEISLKDKRFALREIERLIKDHSNNRFVASCREAAYTFGEFRLFKDVVMASFEDNQVQDYINRWFEHTKSVYTAEERMEMARECWRLIRLRGQEHVKQLARTPLLLTLLCSVYEKNLDFPKNKSLLISHALSVVMKDWAKRKRVEYPQRRELLDSDLQEALLSEVAYSQFKEGNIVFYKKDILRSFSKGFEGNLNAPTSLDSEMVLQITEIQQGILVERYIKTYSFSHLTLQEYFTAQYIVDNEEFKKLVSSYLFEERWREVFTLTAGLIKGKSNWSPQQNCLIANGAKVCSIRVMKPPRPEPTLPEIDPEEQGARYWYERYCEQLAETEQLKRRVKELEKQFESLNEKLRKLSERTSETSSQPPSSDGPKKPNRDQQKPQRKRGPKYNHPGTTRNGFGWINHAELLDVQNCPICGGAVERQPQGTQRQQVAELVPELVEVWEYERPLYRCPACGWQGYQDLPLGCREGFSYGGRLSSVVGWLGYGGNLSWSKQRYVVESIFGIPMSQGSLAKLHQWFCEALQPAYEQWWTWIQQPGVRCVDETSYRLNGVNHWIWIATAPECCVLFFAPSRSSAEVKTLLGEDFAGILSSDCWSAYGPQSAVAKQKCWAHLQRELKALTTSRFPENREFAHRVFPIIHTARQAHRDYHQGQLSLAELQALRPIVEAELADVLEHPHQGRWAADSQALSNRFRRHWSDWFTFLTSPAVSPDNNEAERGLRPVVIHRKVTGGARSDWGAQLVAMMFSCLESMRRQGKNAVDHLFELIASSGCSPPALLPG